MGSNALTGIVNHEGPIRLYCFLGGFALLTFWEWAASRRAQKVPRFRRWPHNLTLTFLNTLVLRFVFPSGAIAAADWAQSRHFGLFQWAPVAPILSIPFTVLALDSFIYFQHRVFHAVPLLWKFHRMHHTDLEVDVTTGTRFHTVEMILSMLLKYLLVLVLGAAPFGVFLFELILNLSSMFSHSNVILPVGLDAFLRVFIVTPDMHRVHHSVIPAETNSNFGFNLSIWDRWLGTYRPEPRGGQEEMKMGLEIFRDLKYLSLGRLLGQPFFDERGHFAWNNLTRKN